MFAWFYFNMKPHFFKLNKALFFVRFKDDNVF